MSTANNVFERHWRLCTPITGAAHEAYILVGTEDVSFEITLDTDYCLIIKLENTGDMSQAGDFQLQYNVDAAGFNDVNASSSNVRTVDSGDADNASSTTERLTAVSETFSESMLDDVDGLQGRNMSGHESAEYYYAINFRSAELSGGETIIFQLLAGGSDTNTHSEVPTVTVPVVGITRSPPVGSLTLTGQAPTLVQTFSIEVPVGTLALTGFAPVAIEEMSIDLPTGTLVLTGQTPTLVQTDNLIRAPPVGSLTLTGQTPALLQDMAVLPGVGSLTLTGQVPTRGTGLRLIGHAPTLVEDANITRSPGVGSLTLTGFIPTLIQTFNIPVPVGLLTLTGFAPQIIQTFSIDVPTGSLALTGQAPTVAQTQAAQPGTGTLTLTGQAPLLIQTFSIPVPVGSLTLDGKVPIAQTGDDIIKTPDVGSLTLTGFAPTVVQTFSIPVPVGSLTLTGEFPAFAITIVGGLSSLILQGFVPTLVQTDELVVPVGNLNLTGQTPTLVQTDNQAIAVPVGSLTLTGQVPVVESGNVLIPAAGSLNLTGFVPTLIQAFNIPVPKGSLVLTGQIPTVIIASGAITGDTSLSETDIRAGGKQTIITLTDDTWQAAGTAFDQVRQIILDGITSAQTEATGWNKEVRDKQSIVTVIRTSDTVVTITWSAAPDYDVLANEVITVTVPAAALVTSNSEVVATPTIGVTADIDTIKVHDISFSSVSRSMRFSCDSRSMDFSSASRSMVFSDKLTPDSFILLEDGGKLLLEDGFALLKESE